MFNPSFAIEIIEEIRRDMPIPAVSPPMTPWAGFKFLLNAKYPPSAPPAKAPPMALSIVFPKLSPSLICAIIDMTVRVNPSPTRPPTSIPPAQVNPSFFTRREPTPAPVSRPPAPPLRILSHVNPSPNKTSVIPSTINEIPV